jgi:hypothetical protein
MTAPQIASWLVSGYALLLVAVAWGFDRMAKRASDRAEQWHSGGFVYHEDHDAWKCPEDQWLWPTSFDPENRVMRYRAKPSICNSCPVKDTCTSSASGREVSRQVDQWPHSEAGRFHRGIACAIAGLAMLMILGQALIGHGPADLLVLGGALLLVLVTTFPLFRHLMATPANAPDHMPHRSAQEDSVAAAIDKYSTRWGTGSTRGDTEKKERETA